MFKQYTTNNKLLKMHLTILFCCCNRRSYANRETQCYIRIKLLKMQVISLFCSYNRRNKIVVYSINASGKYRKLGECLLISSLPDYAL